MAIQKEERWLQKIGRILAHVLFNVKCLLTEVVVCNYQQLRHPLFEAYALSRYSDEGDGWRVGYGYWLIPKGLKPLVPELFRGQETWMESTIRWLDSTAVWKVKLGSLPTPKVKPDEVDPPR